MQAHRRDGLVVVGDDARQRFHDARGYGRPLEGNEIALAPVEAAHLLFRGDLDDVDGADFGEFLAREAADVGARFLAYADLRSRGFYLSPAREGWVADGDGGAGVDFVVYERGSGPPNGAVEHRIRVLGERTAVPAGDLGDVVLAVVDEEGDVSYYETGRPEPAGSSTADPPSVRGTLLSDRVVVWDPPADLYERRFYGQPLAGREGDAALQLSLVEAAYLAGRGALELGGGADADGTVGAGVDAAAGDGTTIVERGRDVEGGRFDRRLTVYGTLRDRGVVPKTGFKFGADFRTYAEVESVDDLGHSEDLIRVLQSGHTFEPRELALDVRLAGGVRKRMVFALVDGEGDIEWLSVGRLTP